MLQRHPSCAVQMYRPALDSSNRPLWLLHFECHNLKTLSLPLRYFRTCPNVPVTYNEPPSVSLQSATDSQQRQHFDFQSCNTACRWQKWQFLSSSDCCQWYGSFFSWNSLKGNVEYLYLENIILCVIHFAVKIKCICFSAIVHSYRGGTHTKCFIVFNIFTCLSNCFLFF